MILHFNLTWSLLCLFLTAAVFPVSAQQYSTISPSPEFMEDLHALAGKKNIERFHAIRKMLARRNIPCKIQRFEIDPVRNYPRVEGNNIYCSFGESDSVIIIGAHYDAALIGSYFSDAVVDNGCSVVILAGIAAELSKRRPDSEIVIAFFDMEEIGMRGSKSFLDFYTSKPIRYAINLDVCSYGSTVIFGPRSKDGNNEIYRALKEICVEKDVDFVEFPGYPGSDDISFRRKGIKTISIGIVPPADAHKMWLLMNAPGGREFQRQLMPGIAENIHSVHDEMERADPKSMAVVKELILSVTGKLSRIE